MTSYLQAWHAKPDNTLWLFIGTYEDELVRVNGEWKIAKMLLVKVSGDTRTIDPECRVVGERAGVDLGPDQHCEIGQPWPDGLLVLLVERDCFVQVIEVELHPLDAEPGRSRERDH